MYVCTYVCISICIYIYIYIYKATYLAKHKRSRSKAGPSRPCRGIPFFSGASSFVCVSRKIFRLQVCQITRQQLPETYTCVCVCVYSFVLVHIYIYIHTHTHTNGIYTYNMHACTHAYTHIHTYTCMSKTCIRERAAWLALRHTCTHKHT